MFSAVPSVHTDGNPLTNELASYSHTPHITAYENDFVPLDENVTGNIPPVPYEYLEKIVKLCKETDTELILTVIPYRADVDNNSVTGVYQQSLYNTVKVLAENWDVEYINLLHHLEPMGFDFKTDMAEFSHLNMSGSTKVSEYFGAILKNRLEKRYEKERNQICCSRLNCRGNRT